MSACTFSLEILPKQKARVEVSVSIYLRFSFNGDDYSGRDQFLGRDNRKHAKLDNSLIIHKSSKSANFTDGYLGPSICFVFQISIFYPLGFSLFDHMNSAFPPLYLNAGTIYQY
jgi:hypothetical protein